MSIMETLFKVADEIRIAANFGVLPVAILVWLAGICTLWEWKETKPRDAKWWLLCGMVCHWTGTILTLMVDLMSELGSIRIKTAHLIFSQNRIFVLIAGIIYLKALTEFWQANLWKWVGLVAVFIIISVYSLRVI